MRRRSFASFDSRKHANLGHRNSPDHGPAGDKIFTLQVSLKQATPGSLSINTPPGFDMALMTLDPTRGQMVPYGTGTVSDDGSQIVPDLDPTHPGHRFGIVHFDWHGPMPPPPPQTNPGPPGGGSMGPGGPC